MARSSATDRRFLEKWGAKWRVSYPVPRKLQATVGKTKLKRGLPTDSLAVANRLKWPIVAEFKAILARAEAGATGTELADEFRRQRITAPSAFELEEIDEHILMTAEDIRGEPVGEDLDPDTGEPYEVFDPAKEARAAAFLKLSKGEATPVDRFHDQYLTSLSVKPRTLSDDKRAMVLLKQWCEETGTEPYLQAFNRKTAVKFVDWLPTAFPKKTAVTLNKTPRRLSRYWSWLQKRDEVEDNVWRSLTLPEPPTPHGQEERPFTDDEILMLLNGDASPEMHDVMRIGALTGCRLDPIVCLRVRDCREDGVFVFKPQKKEKAARLCPIHPDLQEIVQRRTANKEPDDPLFPEWPGPKDPNSKRERSFKTSNEFTEYRRKVGVKEELPGKRRSLVNFHSFRRWFVTKAEQAGQPEHLIAAAVGHKRQGITLGVYSAGPLIEQVRAVVEAVQLPEPKTPRD